MCCPFSCAKARVENITATASSDNKSIKFIGYVNFSPQTVTEALLRFFQRLELAESYAEIGDGTFDLFGKLFQSYINQHILDTLHDLHKGAHNLEEMLHAICFFGDLTRIISGRFIEYHDRKKTQVDHIRTIARLFLAGSNLSATLSFGAKLRSGTIGYLETAQITLSFTGYTLLIISTLWRRFRDKKQHHFVSDLSIYVSGAVHAVVPLLRNLKPIKPFVYALKKIRSFSHIVHGYSKKKRLTPPDRVKIEGEIKISV